MSAGKRAGENGRSALLRQAAGDLLFPRRCPYCGRVIGYLPYCEDCAPRLEALIHRPYRLQPDEHRLDNLEGAASVFRYEGEVRRAILAMKFEGRPWYGRELGYTLAQWLFGCTFKVHRGIIAMHLAGMPRLQQDLVVSVPSSRKARGYDSTALMAFTLAGAVGLPYAAGALRRVRQTRPQGELSLEERLVNEIGAMEAARPEELEGRRVLLVDDVVTTGATLTEAARALLKGGAMEVFAVTAASTPAHRDEEEA